MSIPPTTSGSSSIDPYRGEAWAKIPRGSKADADKAVKAANEAMWRGPWSKMTASARGKVMRKLGDLVAANAERLAEIEVRDNGKLMAEMLRQLRYHPEWWWYFGGLVDKLEGGLVPIDKPETFAYTTHEPVGVVAALTAWNSPLLFVAWKCAAALAAGCAVIVKPSEFTSASTLEFAALTKEAGIPDGIFNVVTGFGPEIGTELVSHPGVAKITFTGSDATGAKVYETAARSLKRVSLELGGKSPNIVFEDADLGAAAAGVISGIFAATGQTCIAGSRLLVQNSIKDKFVERLVELGRVRQDRRPHATGHQYRSGHHAGAVQEDPRLYRHREGGRRALPARRKTGLAAPASRAASLSSRRFSPTSTIRCGSRAKRCSARCCRSSASIPRRMPSVSPTTPSTVLPPAYGPRTSARAVRVPKLLRAGTVWVNTYRAISYMMPFGGMKHSGLGRESGIDAVREYLETKSVWISTATDVPANPFVMR